MAAEANIKGKLTLDDNPFTRALRRGEGAAGSAARKIAGYFSNLAGPLLALGPAVAAAFSGAAIAQGTKGVMDYAGGLVDLSAQTGITIDRLVGLERQFQDAGMATEDVGKSVNKLQKYLREAGNGEGSKELDALGLSAAKLAGLAPEEQLRQVGLAIGNIEDPAERVALSMEVFGKAGGKMLAVFSDPNFGKAPSGALGRQAEVLKRNAELFDSVSDRLAHVGDVFRGFYLGLADRVAPGLSAMLDRIDQVDLVSMGQGFGDGIITGASAFVDLLLAVKQSGFLPSMQTICDGLAWAGRTFRDLLLEAGRSISATVQELRAIAQFLGFDVSGWPQPAPPGGESPPAPAPDGGGDQPAPADDAPERVEITGGAWSYAMSDRTSLGRAAARRMGLGDDLDGATGRPESGGLSGPGSDTAEESRQRLAKIRSQVKGENPDLVGWELEKATRAQDAKTRREAQGGSPMAADAAGKGNPATAAGQAEGNAKLKDLLEKIDKLIAS